MLSSEHGPRNVDSSLPKHCVCAAGPRRELNHTFVVELETIVVHTLLHVHLRAFYFLVSSSKSQNWNSRDQLCVYCEVKTLEVHLLAMVSFSVMWRLMSLK